MNLNLIVMRTNLVKISIVLITIPLLNSCATMFFGTSQKVSINSTPPGADVYKWFNGG